MAGSAGTAAVARAPKSLTRCLFRRCSRWSSRMSGAIRCRRCGGRPSRTGLTVHAELDTGAYPTGVKVSDVELNAVPVTGHAFHGEWNHTVHPRPAGPADPTGPTPGPALVFDRDALSHPALTGMTRTALTRLTETLTADWQALQKQDATTRRDGGQRRRAPGGGRKAKLDLADRVLLTVLQQNLALPPTALAHLFAVSKDTIRHTTREIRRLMDQHAHTPTPSSTPQHPGRTPRPRHRTRRDPHNRDKTNVLILYGP